MSFRIDDIDFGVESALLQSFIDEYDLIWNVEVQCKKQLIQDRVWQPRLTTDSLIRTERQELPHWNQWKTQTLRWDDGYDEEEDEYRGNLYVFEHTAVNQSILTIDYDNNLGFHLSWQGKADIFFSKEKYWEAVPFHVEIPLVFDGVLFGRLSEEVSRAQLKQFMPEANFSFLPGPPSRLIPAD